MLVQKVSVEIQVAETGELIVKAGCRQLHLWPSCRNTTGGDGVTFPGVT